MLNRFARFSLAISEIDRCWHKLAAAEMAKQGLEAKEIAEKVRELADCVDASFIVDNLEYLAKGGRCSAVAAFGANLLQLKPCINVKNGAMGVGREIC